MMAVTPAYTAPAIADATSRRIRIARVLCILAVVWVHSPPYGDRVPTAAFTSDGVVWLIREMFARSSVPLLSVISGYLAIRLDKGSYPTIIRKKFFTLIVPLFLWNLIGLANKVLQTGTFPSLIYLPKLLLGVTGYPMLLPLYFLRDVFVCNLLLPILLLGVRRATLITLAALLLNAIHDADGPLFLNSAIPLFFVAGLALGDGRLSTRWIARRPAAWAIGSATVLLLIATLPLYASAARTWGTDWSNAVTIAQRTAGAIFFWIVAGAALNGAAGRLARRYEPIIFFIFCGHLLLLGAAWKLFGLAGLVQLPAAVLAFFLLSPVTVLMLSIMAVLVLGTVMPKLLAVLIAGRVPTEEQRRALVPRVVR